jgi:6-pyruvoyltetrahydropterin/6-carboxytetrahydropterin synthase
MAKIRVTKEFDFEMAHALDGHDGKCHNIHGHTYQLSVCFEGSPIDAPCTPKDGMVIDFADIKRIVKHRIVDVYDHALVLRDNSRFLGSLNNDINERLMLKSYQPTCENLLIDMVNEIQLQLKNLENVRLHSARLRETLSSYAEWYADDNK